MRVLVTGDRDWDDWQAVYNVLNGYYADASCGWLTVTASPFIVIEGGAHGADRAAHDWVFFCPLHGEVVDLATYDPMTYQDKPSGMPVAHIRYDADWNQYGKAAGPIRNRVMLKEGKPDLVHAFHDDLANSKGTKDMVTITKDAGVKVYLTSRP